MFRRVLFLITLFWSCALFAQTLPKVINFQSVLADPAGVSLADGLHKVNFRIVTADGQEIYQESQTLESVHGVVSAMIGDGNDLDWELLRPNPPKFLGVQVEGQGPETLLEIVSVPYSFYAQEAFSVSAQSIGHDQIIPKSITADLLADTFAQDFFPNLAPDILPQAVVLQNELDLALAGLATTTEISIQNLDLKIRQEQTDIDLLRIGLDQKLSKDGSDIFGGTLNMGNNRVSTLAEPQQATDAATKNYVDQQISAVAANASPDPNVGNNNSPQTRAWGLVGANGGNAPSLQGGNNIASVSLVADPDGGNSYQINFQNSVNPPYVVVANTLHETNAQGNEGVIITIEKSQNAAGFKIRTRLSTGGVVTPVNTYSFNFAVIQ